ncbi:MAG: M50 family metallopeptidase [Patescibacteria group bacterium]
MFIIVFIIILSILVLIHEFGHFIVAKKNGIKVEEFGLGFPPRIWGKQFGETLYSINALPLGGFVKVYGEEYHEHEGKVTQELRERGFVYKKPWQKAAVLIAGVCMNLLLAIVIFYGLLATNNFTSDPLIVFNNHHFRFGETQGRVVVADVVDNSVAQKAGVVREQSVRRFNLSDDLRPSQWVEVESASQLVNTIKKSGNTPITLELENIKNGRKQEIQVIPQYDQKLKRAIIGAQLVDTVVLRYQKPIEKVFSGILHSYNMAVYNMKTIGFLIKSSFATKSAEPVSQSLSGPIGIAAFVKDILNSSGEKLLYNLLNVIALFSLSLATINILPFPALDGGRLVFIIYEWITRKRPNATFERVFNTTGFAFLLLMMLFISINDVSKLFMH